MDHIYRRFGILSDLGCNIFGHKLVHETVNANNEGSSYITYEDKFCCYNCSKRFHRCEHDKSVIHYGPTPTGGYAFFTKPLCVCDIKEVDDKFNEINASYNDGHIRKHNATVPRMDLKRYHF